MHAESLLRIIVDICWGMFLLRTLSVVLVLCETRFCFGWFHFFSVWMTEYQIRGFCYYQNEVVKKWICTIFFIVKNCIVSNVRANLMVFQLNFNLNGQWMERIDVVVNWCSMETYTHINEVKKVIRNMFLLNNRLGNSIYKNDCMIGSWVHGGEKENK